MKTVSVLGCLGILLVTTLVMATPQSGEFQPDCINFGEVHQGAIVEGSFLVFNAGIDPAIEFDVTAPKFAKVLQKTTSYQQYGPGNDFIRGIVSFRVDTSTVGEVFGKFDVKLGAVKVSVPITAIVKPRKTDMQRVLIAESPFDAYSTGDGNDLKPWTDLARDAALDVSYLDVERGKPVFRDLNLATYQTILLADNGLLDLTPEDVKRVREFIEAGGRVVLAANAFMVGSVVKANEVLAGSGIEMQDVEAQGLLVNAATDDPGLSSVLVDAGIKSVRFFRGSPTIVTEPRSGQVLVRAEGVGREEDGFVAMAEVKRGQVLTLGQSLWWSWITEKKADGADNSALLRWLLTPPK
jgi:hypothetical protein